MKKIVLIMTLILCLCVSSTVFGSCKNKDKDDDNNDGAFGEGIGDLTVNDSVGNGSSNNNTNTYSKLVKKNFGSVDYWCYAPESEHENLPVIVYLHDTGVGSFDEMPANDEFLRHIDENGLEFDAYVVALHLESEKDTWHGARNDVRALVNHVILNNKADSSAVYLTGVGKGAVGVYRIAMAMPTVFAAYAPIGGTHDGAMDTQYLANLKIFAYLPVENRYEIDPIYDFMFELVQVNDKVEVITIEDCEPEDYEKLYFDSEYDILKKLVEN